MPKAKVTKEDKEWAIAIKKKYKNKCAVCKATKYLNAHHLIPRQIKKYRHDMRNGICLCVKHHRFSFELSAHQNPFEFYYWLMMKMQKVYQELTEMTNHNESTMPVVVNFSNKKELLKLTF